MKRRQWGRRGRAAAVSAAFALGVGGCASTPSGSGSLAAPPNYRQLVAAKLRQMEDVSVIQSVEISAPRERFVGLIYGGSRPAVCVQVIRPNIFSVSAAWYYLFYFENGQTDGHKMMPTNAFEQALFRCNEPLTPITALLRSRR